MMLVDSDSSFIAGMLLKVDIHNPDIGLHNVTVAPSLHVHRMSGFKGNKTVFRRIVESGGEWALGAKWSIVILTVQELASLDNIDTVNKEG